MRNRIGVIHPFLFAIFNILFLYYNNIGNVDPGSLIAPLVVTLAFVLVLCIVVRLFVKDPGRTAVVVSIFVMFFFSYGHFFHAVKPHIDIPIIKNETELTVMTLTMWVGALLLLSFFAVKLPSKPNAVGLFLNVVAIILIIKPLVGISAYHLTYTSLKNGWSETDKTRAVSPVPNGDTPNIFLIILDAYAGAGVLDKYYGFDNSEFVGRLIKKGFFVAENSRSNYCQTGLSMASLLNMRYLDNERDGLKTDSVYAGPIDALIRKSEVFRYLRRVGYRIAVISSGRKEFAIKGVDHFILPRTGPDEFQNMLINTTPLPIVLDQLEGANQFDIYRDRMLREFDAAVDASGLKPPVFVLMHIEAPHPPFVFGRNGEKIDPEIFFQEDDGDRLIRKGRMVRAEYVKRYIDQLIFINKKVITMTEAILARSKKSPVIIIQGDHGPRSMLFWDSPEKTDLKECMSILNAYYLPRGIEALYDAITPVNSFRAVFNGYFNAGYDYLEDKSFFSTEKAPYRFIEAALEAN